MRATVLILAVSMGAAVAAACSSDDNSTGSDAGGGESGGGSGSGSGGGSGGRSSSSGVTLRDVGAPMQIGTAPGSVPGGINCGMSMTAQCATSQVCCWGDQTQMPAPLPGCTTAAGCMGSSLACSATSHCPSGQICCFMFTNGGGGGGMGPFTAQCANQCPSGDMVHYQLCASDSDCLGGGTCSMMAPYSSYCMGGDGGGSVAGDAATGDGAVGDGAPLDSGAPSPDAADAGSTDAGTADAADARGG